MALPIGTVQAEILFGLNEEASQAAIAKYSTAFEYEYDGRTYSVQSLNKLDRGGETYSDFANWDFEKDITLSTSTIAQWNTDVVAAYVWDSPKYYSYVEDFSIPTSVKDTLGRNYQLKYLMIVHSDGAEYHHKLELTDRLEMVWSYAMKGYTRGQFCAAADTIVIGTSLRSVATSIVTNGGCRVLYLKAGIPYHYGRDYDIMAQVLAQLRSDVTPYDLSKYGFRFSFSPMPEDVTAYNKTYVSLQEIHVPKGFRQYYLTDDEDTNGKIVDDLPVVPCKEIQMRKATRLYPPYSPYPRFTTYRNITGDTIAVAVGDSVPLDIVCEPYNSTVRYSARMSSSDEGVATVDSLAMIRATGVGWTVIKAEALDGSGVSSQIVLRVDTPEALATPHSDARLSDDRYYDILGRPVTEPAHGLYIHRGKKVML